jgi:hypothetical protein
VIERAIENWLTKTNERNYLRAFCQVLMHEGHRVLFTSSHGPMEQGKDVITIAPDGVCCAYQTKTGDIKTSEWRAIEGELRELVELPIDYPGVDKTKMHRAYLVTNGTISDPVRAQISDRNEDNVRKNRQYAPLEVIAGDSLLKSFVDAQQRFVPRNPPDLRAFLDLYLDKGTGMLPKGKLFAVLENAVFSERPGNKSAAVDAITSSLVITSYLLNSFEQTGNSYAIAEGWSILAASIARFVTKYSIPATHWEDSLRIVIDAIGENLARLRADALGRSDFLEGAIHGDGGAVLRARATIVLGALACHELSANLLSQKSAGEVVSLIRQHYSSLLFWGESSFPYLFYICRFLETSKEESLAQKLLDNLFIALVDGNFKQSSQAHAPPYYEVTEILESTIPDRIPSVDFSGWRGSSYVIRSLLEMLVRRGKRELVADQWRRFSYCQQHEFIPDRAEDIFSWRTSEGTNASRFPNQTESWIALQNEAQDLSAIPPIYTDFISVLRYHILTCPYRATPRVLRLLDRS